MDFTRKTRIRVEKKVDSDTFENLYPHNVMLYRLPPIQDITIYEFEDIALERLKLLRIFEQASSKNMRFMSEEWKESIISELNHEGLKGYLRIIKGGGIKKDIDFVARRRDYISHFILRLAYCRSQDLQRWFIQREMELFRMKFSYLSANEIKNFLELHDLNYIPLSESETSEVKDGLYASTMGPNTLQIDKLEFYKVAYSEVWDLVRQRKCYLKDGYAYVSTYDFVSVIGAKHQAEIERGLQAAQILIPKIENDERLFYLLKGLHMSYTGKDYTISKSGAVAIESLDQLSQKSFPLCMKMCHETLRAKHHHKHGGRLQYGLFLKGIGVTLEDSLRFWREEFTKTMDLEKFEKSYAYGIRYNYGKEGSMINYSPYSCIKIITSSIGPQDTHGCPFKILEPATLKTTLTNYGLSAGHVQEILSFTSKGHYQIACGRYFEITHDVKNERGINHPNHYFELSQTVMGNREQKPTSNAQSAMKSRKLNKSNDKTLLDTYDDDELWDIAETQEGSKNCATEKTNKDLKQWDDDFDLSQMDDSEHF